MLQKIRDNWSLLVLIGGVFFSVTGFVGHVYVTKVVADTVDAQLAKLSIASDPKITEMDKNLDAALLTGQRNKEDIDDLEQRVRDAWNAFLGGQ